MERTRLGWVSSKTWVTSSYLALAKGTVFFYFPGKVHGSFIHSKPKIVFFFPRSGKKKYKLVFFSWKSSYAIHSKFHGFNVIFNKMGFFFPEILAFFLFFFLEKFTCSFIHSISELFFFPVSEKKQLFHSFNRFCPKMCKKWTFPGK